MKNTATYNAVWDGLLEVARAKQYYYEQEKRLHRPVRALRFALAFFGCGTVASLIDSLSWLAPVSGVAIASLVIIDFLWNGTTRLSQSKIINVLLADLELEYRTLWERVRSGNVEDSSILDEKEALLERLNHIAATADIEVDEKIIQQAQERAFAGEALRYAA